MLNSRNIFVLVLALAFFVVGCGQDQGQQATKSVSEQTGNIVDEGKKMLQQAEQEASQLKDAVVKQAGDIADKAGAIKDNTAAIVADLIANATTSLDEGRFNDAVSSAKEVLTYDSNSQKAKDIIATATEKLKALLAEKTKAAIDAAAALKAEETIDTAAAAKEAESLGSTAAEKVESVKSGLTDKLKSFGQ